MNMEVSRQILEKFSNIKFNKNPNSGKRDVRYDGLTDRQKDSVRTDRHNEANSRFRQICERA